MVVKIRFRYPLLIPYCKFCVPILSLVSPGPLLGEIFQTGPEILFLVGLEGNNRGNIFIFLEVFE
jgi:hypothetical protein